MKGKIIGVGLSCGLAIAIVMVIIFVSPIDITLSKKENEFKDWNRSGPFVIDKFEYKIGDSIFMITEGLDPNDIGSAVFVLPNGTTKYLSIPFDGSQKPEFNQYFKPSISKASNICSTDDIIGEWVVVFQGTQYQPLKFRIINETLPDEERNFQKVC